MKSFLFVVSLSFLSSCLSLTIESEAATGFNKVCADSIESHIKEELRASLKYLVMGAHFSSYNNYRPGLSKFFFDSANEERGHAKKLIEYFLMRGGNLTKNNLIETLYSDEEMTTLLNKFPPQSKDDYYNRMDLAHQLEKNVTVQIVNVVKKCEKDPHANDYLIGEFLQEQHESLRQLGGYMVTLKKNLEMSSESSMILNELMFDNKLLNSE